MSYLFHHNKNCYPLTNPTAPTPKSPGNWNQYRGNKAYRSFGKYPTQPHDSAVTRERKFWTLGSTSWAPILWCCDLISNLQSLLLWMNGHYLRVLVRARKEEIWKLSAHNQCSVNSSYVWCFLSLQQSKLLFYLQSPASSNPTLSVKPAVACRMAHQTTSSSVSDVWHSHATWKSQMVLFLKEYIFFKIFIYLSALGLSCGTQDPRSLLQCVCVC